MQKELERKRKPVVLTRCSLTASLRSCLFSVVRENVKVHRAKKHGVPLTPTALSMLSRHPQPHCVIGKQLLSSSHELFIEKWVIRLSRHWKIENPTAGTMRCFFLWFHTYQIKGNSSMSLLGNLDSGGHTTVWIVFQRRDHQSCGKTQF